jgi:monoamine oxidase
MLSGAPTVNGMSSATIFDVIVIGGGLSGLVVGSGLVGHSRIKNWKILEGSDRLGGRLVNASPTIPIDMGGAWIWPEHQPHIRDLATNLNVTTFIQPDDPSSTRIDGGAVRIVEKLSDQIQNSENMCSVDSVSNNSSRIVLNTHISSCKLLKDHQYAPDRQAIVQLTSTGGELFLSRKVVFAVPPKILSESIAFDPPLSDAKNSAMAVATTWMAGVTKVALLYPQKFWDKEVSNSGLPASTGPAFQVYDSSTKDASLSALTFFVHVPENDELAQANDAIVAKQVAAQIATLWKYYGKSEHSKEALSYTSFHVYRWPKNRFISGNETKPTQIHPHPTPMLALSTPEWDNLLFFAGTESDLMSPGVMEGAVSSAKRVLKSLFK